MKPQQPKLLAALGLASIAFFAGAVLGGAYFCSSPNALKNLRVWQIGAEYLGNDGVSLQEKPNNCGSHALKMIFDHYGIASSLLEIEGQVGQTASGSSLLSLKVLAELKGLQTEGMRFTISDLPRAPTPAIAFVHGNHFVVLDSINGQNEVFVRDPAIGKLKMPIKSFPQFWNGETLIFRRRQSDSMQVPAMPPGHP